MSQQNSVLSVKPAGQSAFLDVPVIRGKSAYQHAIEGGLLEDITETQFNEMMSNMVYGDTAGYKIKVVNSKPSTFDPNSITIVLSD